jgi:hypothetical protein
LEKITAAVTETRGMSASFDHTGGGFPALLRFWRGFLLFKSMIFVKIARHDNASKF